jgi:hypothetical protein
MAKFINLDEAEAFKELSTYGEAPLFEALLTPRRIASSSLPMGGGLTFNWAASPID